MSLVETVLVLLIIVALVVLLFWLFITSIEKAFEQLGFSRGEAGTLVFLTLIFGVVDIPLFKYNGWWLAINVGGALIPIIICVYLLVSRRVSVAEGMIGVIIVTFITYYLTRAVQNEGIVADFPWAFAPALAAGLYSISTFWIDIKRAAPLAYFSGVLGTLVGADVFHLGDILAFPVESGGPNTLSIGGAQVFDLVYLSGIVAIGVDSFVFWVRRQEKKHGIERVISEFEKQAQDQPYAKEPMQAPGPVVKAAPPMTSARRASTSSLSGGDTRVSGTRPQDRYRR